MDMSSFFLYTANQKVKFRQKTTERNWEGSVNCMKNGWKRMLAVLMALTMVLALLPVNAWAVEPEEDEPVVYADETENEAVVVYETEEEAVAAIRKQLKQRATSITVRLRTVDSGPIARMLYAAWAHDANDPTGGDYIHYQVAKYQYGAKTDSYNGTTDFYYTLAYYDTLEQEKELDTKIAEVLESLNLNGKSDYEKVKAIYDYICANVKYDNKHLNDAEYTLKYTAYAALIKGTAVCQGYANLFYRMALSVGVDCRVITGLADNTGHGWNIVRLKGEYYNVDSTWDAGVAPENYNNFLKSPDNFDYSHIRDTDFNSADFWTEYPMALEDYYPVTAVRLDNNAIELDRGDTRLLSATVDPDFATESDVTWTSSEPTVVTIDNSGKITAVDYGIATIRASAGGKTATCTVTVKHTHSLKAYSEKKATCIETGNMAYWECTLCGELFRDAQGTVKTNLDDVKTDKDTTNHAGGQEVRNVKQVTCTVDGYTGDTYCLGCNAKIADGAKIDKLVHTLVAHDAKQATCKDKGNDAYWECTTCGGLFSNAQGTVSTTLEAVSKPQDSENHAADTKLVGKKDATCTENGYTGDEVCADCGAVLTKGTATDKSAHQLTHVAARIATCKESGNIEYWKCESCGGLFRDGDGKNEVKAVMTVDGNNHVGGTELRNEKVATCTAEGYTGDKYCLSCGEKVAAGTVTSKVSHELTRHEAVAATHSAAGSIAYWSCAACSGLFSDAAGKQPITAQETVIRSEERR